MTTVIFDDAIPLRLLAELAEKAGAEIKRDAEGIIVVKIKQENKNDK